MVTEGMGDQMRGDGEGDERGGEMTLKKRVTPACCRVSYPDVAQWFLPLLRGHDDHRMLVPVVSMSPSEGDSDEFHRVVSVITRQGFALVVSLLLCDTTENKILHKSQGARQQNNTL